MRHPLVLGLLRSLLLLVLPLVALPVAVTVLADLGGTGAPVAAHDLAGGPPPASGAVDSWSPAGPAQPASTRLAPTDRQPTGTTDDAPAWPSAVEAPAPARVQGTRVLQQLRPASPTVPGTPEGRAPPRHGTNPCQCS